MVSADKKNWILIRGLSRGAGHWSSFADKIQVAFPKDQFYFIDIPGNGYLNNQDTPLRVSDFIPSFEQQLKDKKFDFDLPTIGLSLSLGSMSMVEWAKQSPNFFKKIILMNTSASNFSNLFERLSPNAFLLIFKFLKDPSLAARELESLVITTTLTKNQILTDYENDLNSIIKFSQDYACKPKNVFRQLAAAALYKFPEKINTHVVIISSAKDKFVSPNCSLSIVKKWNCQHIINEKAGHDISFQYPDWLVEQLKVVTT